MQDKFIFSHFWHCNFPPNSSCFQLCIVGCAFLLSLLVSDLWLCPAFLWPVATNLTGLILEELNPKSLRSSLSSFKPALSFLSPVANLFVFGLFPSLPFLPFLPFSPFLGHRSRPVVNRPPIPFLWNFCKAALLSFVLQIFWEKKRPWSPRRSKVGLRIGVLPRCVETKTLGPDTFFLFQFLRQAIVGAVFLVF